MKACTSLLLGFALALALSATAFAHIGEMQFVPQVPDPAAMTIDGNDDDWGWMDPAYAWTSDKLTASGAEADFTREDFDVVYFLGWSAPPDNENRGAFYVFARVTDDVLDINEDNPDWWWADDSFMLAFDGDHSGGSMYGDDLEQIANGQRWQIRMAPAPEGGENAEYGTTGMYFGPSIYIGHPELNWGQLPPYCDFAATILPAGSIHGATDVTYTYEIKMGVWDSYGLNAAESTPHIFAADDVMHVVLSFGDTDMVDGRNSGGQDSYLGLGGSGTNMDESIDHMMVAGEVAVEPSTWGRIKSAMDRRLSR